VSASWINATTSQIAVASGALGVPVVGQHFAIAGTTDYNGPFTVASFTPGISDIITFALNLASDPGAEAGTVSTISSDAASQYVAIGTNAQYAAGMLLSVNGDMSAQSVTSWSDRTFKKDIESLEASNSLALLQKVRPVAYNWRIEEFPERKFSKSRDIGFIAQEMKEIVPEVVKGDKDGELSIDYGKLVAHLVGAIQSLSKEMDELKAKLA